MKMDDKVVMNGKYPVKDEDKGKVYTCRSNPMDVDGDGELFVTLMEKSGLWHCDGLDVVEKSHESD